MKKISNSLCKNIFFNQLKKIKYGSIIIIDEKNMYLEKVKSFQVLYLSEIIIFILILLLGDL